MLKRFLALSLIFVLLSAATNFHIPQNNLKQKDAAALAKLYGNSKILICTPTGYKYVTFTELAKYIDHSQKQKHNCGICLAAHATKIFLGDNFAYSQAIIYFVTAEKYIHSKNFYSSEYFSNYNPRSPPVYLT